MINERPKYQVEIVEPIQDKGSINEAHLLMQQEIRRKHQRVEHNTMTVSDNMSRFSALDQKVDEF